MGIKVGEVLSDQMVGLIRRHTSLKERNQSALNHGLSGANNLSGILRESGSTPRAPITKGTRPVIIDLLGIAIMSCKGDMETIGEIKEGDLVLAEEGEPVA